MTSKNKLTKNQIRTLYTDEMFNRANELDIVFESNGSINVYHPFYDRYITIDKDGSVWSWS